MNNMLSFLNQLQRDTALREIIRAECEESLYAFLQYAWRIIDPSPFIPGWPLEAVCEHLEAVADGDIKRLIINIPPRMGKSSITNVCFGAWVWAQPIDTPTLGPTVPMLHASYATKLARRDSVKTRRLIESPWYQSLWGDRFKLTDDQNTKDRFQNNKGGERHITSVEAKVTGEGGNIIVIDDANAANEVLSEAVIETTKEWWDGTMSTRLNDTRTGAFVVIQQRLAEQDLTGHILETAGDEEWTRLCLPMEFERERSFVTSIGWQDPREEEGELLWPERFPADEVRKLSKRLGSWKAAGQLQQHPEPKGGGIIKRNWWLPWKEKTFPPLSFIVAALDTAYTEKQENDPSALTIWGVFDYEPVAQVQRTITRSGRVITERTHTKPHPRVVLLWSWAERLELNDLVKRVNKDCVRWRVDKLLIESKAAGHSTAQEIRRIYGGEKYSTQLVDPKNLDKMARLYSVQHLFEEGLIFAPDTDWAAAVITQCATFPRAAHDDLVDTTSLALKHLRDLGLLIRGEEHTAELDESMRYKGPPPQPLYAV